MKGRMHRWFPVLFILALLSGCGKDAQEIRSIEDARNARIGVMTGSTGEELALQMFPEADIKSFDDVMDAVTAMMSDKLDAIVTAYPTALQVTKKHTAFRVLEEPLRNENTCIALRKGNPALLTTLNGIIDSLHQDGTLADMRRRWFKNDLSPYEERTLEVPTKGEVLKIGVTATREPMSFMDRDAEVSGFDGELARIIGRVLRRPVEFHNMKFMGLIPALQSAKIDLVITGMTATAERKRSVDFTKSYFENAQVMLVKTAAPHGDGKVRVLKDIDGKRVAVLSGSAGDLAARRRFRDSEFLVMENAADAAVALNTRKADAFIYDRSVLENIARQEPGLVILGEPVAKLEVAAALKKGNTALASELNEAIGAFTEDGTLAMLRKKWIDGDGGSLQESNAGGRKGEAELRMGTCATLAPFSYHANGEITGLDIELARMIGNRLQKKITLVDMPFGALIPALQAGKIDFALSNFNVTEERKKLILFSRPYLQNDISALVLRSAAAPAAPVSAGASLSAPDLNGMRVAVLLGSTHDTYALSHYPNATLLQYKTPSDIILAVKSGKVDAGIYTTETLREIFRADPSLELKGGVLFSVPVAMGFNKQNDSLREQFNVFLQDIRQNGVYRDMVDRWITRGEDAMPSISGTRANGVLRVGVVSDKGLPFMIVKNNRLVGFDEELAERFAAYLGKEIKTSDMDFGNLIAAAATNKIDMIASTLMITPERALQISFSDPYYEIGASAFVMKTGGAEAVAGNDAPGAAYSFIQPIVDGFQNNIIKENRWKLILSGLRVTVIISVLSALFGTVLGAGVCAMRMSSAKTLKTLASVFISLLRGTPVLVLLMLIFYVVFASVSIDPVAVAVIAFGLNFAAYVAEIFRSGVESIDNGQREAGISMGFTRLRTFLLIILPQTIQRILPVYKGEFLSLVKMTSIVGYIAVEDLTKAGDIIRSRTFDAFFPLIMVAILYFSISWLLLQSMAYLERRTDPKFKRIKTAV
ncbi:ABC transporter permease subunit [Chlorobium phaeovibrioides]|uniref:ABC transporter permease subunit n=1 Tax=Chlorobium phaeovibrioides TaxID=1094 RepID=A0ABW9UW13_CHLPH|nr:ABC transporter permease subunit [Chlorobium phaeovibrioides]